MELNKLECCAAHRIFVGIVVEYVYCYERFKSGITIVMFKRHYFYVINFSETVRTYCRTKSELPAVS